MFSIKDKLNNTFKAIFKSLKAIKHCFKRILKTIKRFKSIYFKNLFFSKIQKTQLLAHFIKHKKRTEPNPLIH